MRDVLSGCTGESYACRHEVGVLVWDCPHVVKVQSPCDVTTDEPLATCYDKWSSGSASTKFALRSGLLMMSLSVWKFQYRLSGSHVMSSLPTPFFGRRVRDACKQCSVFTHASARSLDESCSAAVHCVRA